MVSWNKIEQNDVIVSYFDYDCLHYLVTYCEASYKQYTGNYIALTVKPTLITVQQNIW